MSIVSGSGQKTGGQARFDGRMPCRYAGAMARSARVAPGGVVFHVLSRGVGRRTLFRSERDYAAFEAVLEASLQAVPLRLLAYCLMP